MHHLRYAAVATLAILGLSLPVAAQDTSPWGARPASVCAPLKTAAPPTASQAIQLVRCAKDSANLGSGELWLAQNVKVQLGQGTAFRNMYNAYTMPDADTTKTVYPITGSWMWSSCILKKDAALSGNADRNCTETDVTNAKGACWVTVSQGWKCNMNGASGASRRLMPPPR